MTHSGQSNYSSRDEWINYEALLRGSVARIEKMGRAPKKRYAREWQEMRRERAYELAQAGWPQKAIAAALGVSKGAVSQWLARAADGGREALKSHPAPGGPSKLSAEQLAALPELLERGAEAYGYRGAVWTRGRIRQVIEDVFGVKYHVDHMSFLVRKIGWTQQKPQRVAAQQNQATVEAWQADWPEVEKKPKPQDKR
jgi:transposase